MKRQLFEAYYFADPAFVGLDAKAIVEWGWTRSPEGLEAMGLPDTADPVVYKFRRLTRAQLRFVEKVTTTEERLERAFRAGLVEVRGGRFSETWTPTNLEQDSYIAMSEDEADEAGFVFAEMRDVGQWIYARSMLGKASAPRLRPLPTSLLAWDALALPSAALSQG